MYSDFTYSHCQSHFTTTIGSYYTITQPILCNGDENGAIDITIDPTVGTPPFLINVYNDTTGTRLRNPDYGIASWRVYYNRYRRQFMFRTETIIIVNQILLLWISLPLILPVDPVVLRIRINYHY